MQLSTLSAVAGRLPSRLTSSISRRSVISFRYVSSTTPRRIAKPAKPPGTIPDEATLARMKATPIYAKLAGNQKALAAIQNFLEVMAKQGIDTTSGKQPSFLQLSKLFLQSDVREATKVLAEEFKKAGVDLSSKDVLDQMSAFMKSGDDLKK